MTEPLWETSPTAILSRRHVLIGGALALASGIAFARQPSELVPHVDSPIFEEWVPELVGQRSIVASSGVVLPPPDELSDRLYDNLVTRVYRGGYGSDVMLLLAYSNKQDGMLQVHRPEVCYPAGGFVLTRTQDISVTALRRAVPAKYFTATGQDRTEHVLYFTRLADVYPTSWAQQRMTVIRENLAGRVPDGMLMRVSLLGTDRPAAIETLRTFVGDFVAEAPPPMQKLLIGRAA